MATLSKANSAALIIPALDEEPAIGQTLGRVPGDLYREIIVADNGSRDRTAEIARSHGATVVWEPERGYGAACLRAISALPNNIEAVVFMDADASDDPAEARLLLEPIYEGRADLVIGSRTLGHAEKGALEPHQVLGNRIATGIIHAFYGHRYTDLGPFRAIRAEALQKLAMRDRNYGWTIEMQIKALRHKMRVLEVPVSYRRRVGVSKISGNWRASIAAGVKIMWTAFRLIATR
ncbi:MAG TPA: glycosyltransferase family 2 protein [Bryobacteraceae bacterium]|jgi:glycosyltransferase involved in cell wall biosynthesis|nr:glycosyltransferase family 2 protein [Bryobacteraceae bacterium]